MALRYNGTTIGTISITQERDGKPHKYTLQIRQGNCLAVIIYSRKATPEELAKNPEGRYYHQLMNFYVDEQHMKNIMKDHGTIWPLWNYEKITAIKLNLFYKECALLAKYFTKSGHKVTCYYKEADKPKGLKLKVKTTAKGAGD